MQAFTVYMFVAFNRTSIRRHVRGATAFQMRTGNGRQQRKNGRDQEMAFRRGLRGGMAEEGEHKV